MMTKSLMPLNSLMNGFFYPAATGHTPHSDGSLAPRTRIQTGEKDYIIDLDLPGVKKSDLNIEIEGDVLSISASRDLSPTEGYQILRNELSQTVDFKRSFELSSEVDITNVKADFQDGVLSIRLARSEKAMPRRINVNVK